MGRAPSTQKSVVCQTDSYQVRFASLFCDNRMMSVPDVASRVRSPVVRHRWLVALALSALLALTSCAAKGRDLAGTRGCPAAVIDARSRAHAVLTPQPGTGDVGDV